MLQTTRNSPIPELSVWAPLVLAILRIVSALLLIDQGVITLLHFPQAGVPDALDAGAGVIEVVGGVLIAVGLYTRVAALAAAAEIAMAYGALDRPDTTILFCVIFFYLVFAGPGMWSLDGKRPLAKSSLSAPIREPRSPATTSTPNGIQRDTIYD
jgi:putative oxidoreductase